MAEKWTPGPWSWSLSDDPGGEREIIATRRDDPERHWWIGLVYGGTLDEETEANANLIAAAPELFEQLDALLQWHNEGRVPDAAAIDKAEAALAKARGEP